MGIQINGTNDTITTNDGTISIDGSTTLTGSLTGTTGTFSGDVGVAGTLTSEDKTNIDSVGLITARTGIKIGPITGVAATHYADGSIRTTGIITASSFSGSLASSNLTGALPAIDGSALTGITAGSFFGNATGVSTTKNVGVATGSVTHTNLVGAGNSFVGMYIGDGYLAFNKNLNRSGGYYITTDINALNAGPVTLGSTMTLDGTWIIV